MPTAQMAGKATSPKREAPPPSLNPIIDLNSVTQQLKNIFCLTLTSSIPTKNWSSVNKHNYLPGLAQITAAHIKNFDILLPIFPKYFTTVLDQSLLCDATFCAYFKITTCLQRGSFPFWVKRFSNEFCVNTSRFTRNCHPCSQSFCGWQAKMASIEFRML